MPLIIGVDPGLRGALALYDGETLVVHDMPVLANVVSGKKRSAIDGYSIARILDNAGHIKVAWIEKVGAMPHDGSVQAFAFGAALGEIVGLLKAHFIPIEMIAPVKWRRAMDVPKTTAGDKSPSIARATHLLPSYSHLWAAVRGNGDAHTRGGRAEAALVALYGWAQNGQTK